MLSYERQQQILQLLKEERFVTVPYLCTKLYASGATIRRDLAEMDEKGLLYRVRGGAASIEGTSEDAPLLLRTKTEMEKKRIIASLALSYISEYDTMFFDSSSTISTLAERLGEHKHLTIVTNGFSTANILNDFASTKLYLCAGRMQNQSSIIGPLAIETINKFCVDKFFFSCCGLSPYAGITEANEENATLKRHMFQNAKTRILLCDSTKFNQEFFCKTCDIQDLDFLITDEKPPADFLELFQDTVKIIYPRT